MFGGMSNFPPGHPTGVLHGDSGEIYNCEVCNFLLEKFELEDHSKRCNGLPVREICDKCGELATHIDTDRSVNFHMAYCDKHSM